MKNAKKKKEIKAVFIYTSVCCGKPAKKPALVATPEKEGTLGHWRCTNCERPCKVKRSKVKEINGESASGTGSE